MSDINHIKIQIIDPSGETRVLSMLQDLVVLKNDIGSKNGFRDMHIPENGIQLQFKDDQLIVTDLDQKPNLVCGEHRVYKTSLSLGQSIEVGESILTFLLNNIDLSKESSKAKSIQSQVNLFYSMLPKNIDRWETASDSGLKVLSEIQATANTNMSVYLAGETGTGKDVLARLIHVLSDRKDKPFVAINCGALNDSLAESEFFGHVKGAYTGAHRDRPGALLQAHGGTLFLDEIADLKPDLQVKLLRFLQSGEIRPVGSDKILTSDVRVICATHKSLENLVKQNVFRSDLYYRIASLPIFIPSLRDRLKDVQMLSQMLANKNGKKLSTKALNTIVRHPWHGNVRELQSVIQRASSFCDSSRILLHSSDFDFLNNGSSFEGFDSKLLNSDGNDYVPPLHQVEKFLIIRALRKSNGNRTEAAKRLGLARSTLFEKIKKYNVIGPKNFGSDDLLVFDSDNRMFQ